jgi:predicted membrane protein
MRWKRAKNKNKISFKILYLFFLYIIATKEKKKKPNVVDCEREKKNVHKQLEKKERGGTE